MTHRAIRRTYQAFFLLLFLVLLGVARTGWIRAWPVELFFHLDPLLATGSMLAHRTLGQGLGLSLLVVLATLFVGRAFCGWVCPLGTLNDAVGTLRKRPRATRREVNLPRPLFRSKYPLLATLLTAALLGTLLLGLLDPLSLLVRGLQGILGPLASGIGLALYPHGAPPGDVVSASLLAAILLGNLVVPRLWCRSLCPLGALLALLSRWTPFGIRRDPNRCTRCGVCEESCGGAATPSEQVRRPECVLCMNCRTVCPEAAITWGRVGPPVLERRSTDVEGRRVALATLAGLVAWPLIRAASPPVTSPAERRVRPPGALPEREFLARCARCGMCARACPTGVIRMATDEAGLEGLLTPVMRFDRGYCEVSCVLCGHVCPTGAIQPLTLARKLGTDSPPVKIGTAFLDLGRCLPWAMDTPCVVCEEVCPVSPKAIWTREVTVTTREGLPLALTRPQVDPARCIGCGVCQYHCPVEDRPAIRVSAVGESRGKPLLVP